MSPCLEEKNRRFFASIDETGDGTVNKMEFIDHFERTHSEVAPTQSPPLLTAPLACAPCAQDDDEAFAANIAAYMEAAAQAPEHITAVEANHRIGTVQQWA